MTGEEAAIDALQGFLVSIVPHYAEQGCTQRDNATRFSVTSNRKYNTRRLTVFMMPHSITPESTPADDSSRTVTQDAIKTELETQDVSMEDAPTPPAAEKPKVNLEELFDDEDSDEEFPSSAPEATSQEESSQPAPVYA